MGPLDVRHSGAGRGAAGDIDDGRKAKVGRMKSVAISEPQEKRSLRWLFWILVLPVLASLFLFAYHFLMVMTDSYGTFHSATDLADLDGDGDLDVLLHNVRQEEEFTAFGGTTPWLNQAGGEFEARRLEQDTAGGGWDSAAGDVDRDGDADLVLFMGYQLRLLLNQGGAQGGQAGDFRISRNIAGPERSGQYGSVILGDLNNDGRIDGVVLGCCGRLFTLDPDDKSPNVSGVWINEWNSEGWPGLISVLPGLDGLAVSGAALGDMDGDSNLDLYAAVIAPNEERNRDAADRILFGDGMGGFVDSGQRLGETDSTAVALGDIDGDGDLDALTGTDSGAAVWINQGGAQGGKEGAFAPFEQRLPGDQIKAVFLADLDGDGDLDALVAGIRRATLWLNNGEVSFKRSSQRFGYTKRHGLAVGDLNSDGWVDIFAAAYDDDFRVWFNRGNGVF
jgi:hypothetical protein